MIKISELRVAKALLWRDLIVLGHRLKDDIINVSCMILFFNIIFGFFGPLIGFQPSYVAETFLGTIIGTFLFLGFIRTMDDMFDVKYHKFINYRRILPLSTNCLLFVYFLSYVMHFFAVTAPLLLIGKIILNNALDLSAINWPWFLTLYFLSMFVIALFFFCFVFTVDLDWFRYNIWQRVLTPMHQLGCLFYAWKKAFVFSPKIAYILLLNPLTYCNEGLRAAFLNSQEYIAPLWCFLVLLFFFIVELIFLFFGIRKRLGWV